MARAWKARSPQGVEGSNPSLSALSFINMNYCLEIKFQKSFSLLFFFFALFCLILGLAFIFEQKTFILLLPLGVGLLAGFLYLAYLIPFSTKIFRKLSEVAESKFKKILIHYVY